MVLYVPFDIQIIATIKHVDSSLIHYLYLGDFWSHNCYLVKIWRGSWYIAPTTFSSFEPIRSITCLFICQKIPGLYILYCSNSIKMPKKFPALNFSPQKNLPWCKNRWLKCQANFTIYCPLTDEYWKCGQLELLRTLS